MTNLSPIEQLQAAEQLIANGRTQEALQQLIELSSGSFKRQFLSLLNRWKRIENQQIGGTIDSDRFNVSMNRINTDLLLVMQRFEAKLKGEQTPEKDRRLKLLLLLMVLLIGSLVAVQYSKPKTIIPKPQQRDCQSSQKYLYLARSTNFNTKEEISFTRTLENKLRKQVMQSYKIADVGPQSTNRDTVVKQFFTKTCDTSGLFINTLFAPNPDPALRSFQASIDVVNLRLVIPDLGLQQQIILDNPPNVKFSVTEDAQFLANFITALIRAYEGKAYEALKEFLFLERDSTLLGNDRELKAFIKLNIANALVMRGDRELAIDRYQEIYELQVPGYGKIIKQNLKVANKVERIILKSPSKSVTRDSNIVVHQKLIEAVKSGKILPNQSIKAKRLEEKQLEEVIEVMAEESIREAAKNIDDEKMEPRLATRIQAPNYHIPEVYSTQTNDQFTAKGGDEMDPKNSLQGKQNGSEQQGFDSMNAQLHEKYGEFMEKGVPQRKGRLYMSTVPEKLKGYSIELMKDGNHWMTENLNINVKDCYCYDDWPENCKKYGRLYTWEAAQIACAELGEGWRLPTDEEWMILTLANGGYSDAGNPIKNPRAAYRALVKGGKSRFSAVLGGRRSFNDTFNDLEAFGDYWTSTSSDQINAKFYYFSSSDGRVYRDEYLKSDGRSVRCIKDY